MEDLLAKHGFRWNLNKCDHDVLNLFATISSILGNRQDLLPYLFDKNTPKLNFPSEKILSDSGAFSSGEQICIQLALDIWDGSGNCRIIDIFKTLDIDHIKNVIYALFRVR